MTEKRTTHRLDINLPAFFEIPEAQDHITIATTLNISATGLRLLTKKRLEVGQELPLQINLSHEQTITIHVRVVWVKESYSNTTREYLMGIKIKDSMQADESKFVRFYAEKLMDFFKHKKDAG